MSEINNLISQWREAKNAEDLAKKTRLQLESEIEQTVGGFDKGTTNLETEDGKLVISAGFNESWDQDVLQSIAHEIPANLFPFRYQLKPDNKGVKWIRNNEPEIFAKLEPALTVKPKKPSFSFKGV